MIRYRVFKSKISPNLSRLTHNVRVRTAISVLLAISIASGFWLALPSPVEALTISFPSTPAGTQGISHTFTVRVDIQGATDLLPVQRIDLWVRDPTSINNFTLIGLPLSATTTNFSVNGVGAVSVTADPASTWAYATSGANVHHGYGFGYSTGTWGFQDFGVSGFGYGYTGGIPGDTSIIFTITWIPPTSWTTGTYTTNVIVYGNGDDVKALTSPTPGLFTIFVAPPTPPSSGGGGGGGSGVTDDTLITTFGNIIKESGEIRESVVVFSLDNNLSLNIPKGTLAKNRVDAALHSIKVITLAEPPEVSENFKAVSAVYELLPKGAKFDPSITLTIKYKTSEIPEDASESNLYIAKWNESSQEWVELESTVDPISNSVSTEVNGFSIYTVMVSTHMASFTLADLTISPEIIEIDGNVDVSVILTNTGSLRGSYDVGLMIDGVLEHIREITLDSGSSEQVRFKVTLDTIGEHIINVGGLFGKCEVKEPKASATFSASDLTISPAQLLAGGRVTITITVKNIGDLNGTHELILKIDGFPLESMRITLNAGQSHQVVFSTVQDVVGTHYVDIEGLIGKFEVLELALVPADERHKGMLEPMVATAFAPSLKPEYVPTWHSNPWIITGIIVGGIIAGIALLFGFTLFIREKR